MRREVLVIDDLRYAIRRSSRRKTLGITVERDGSLTISVPVDCARLTIESFEREKRLWVFTKLAERDLLFRRKREREFVSGETFYYLGRAYRLQLVKSGDGDGSPLRLSEGRFRLRRDGLPNARRLLRKWYIEHGQPWVEERVDCLSPRIGARPTSVRVRSLGNRWGSCGDDRTLHFNWRVMSLPPAIIEYIIGHEMIHLVQPRHNADFWERLERVMPDFASRKEWLAANGGEYV